MRRMKSAASCLSSKTSIRLCGQTHGWEVDKHASVVLPLSSSAVLHLDQRWVHEGVRGAPGPIVLRRAVCSRGVNPSKSHSAFPHHALFLISSFGSDAFVPHVTPFCAPRARPSPMDPSCSANLSRILCTSTTTPSPAFSPPCALIHMKSGVTVLCI